MSKEKIHLNAKQYTKLISPRPNDAHKYSHGNVLIVAGSARYPGAAVLAVKAASRAGAGYVQSVVPHPIVQLLQLSALNAPCVGVTDSSGYFATSSVQEVLDCTPARDVIVVGPGMGRERGTDTVVSELLTTFRGPVIADADALTTIANDPSLVVERAPKRWTTVLTPHQREALRLAKGFGIDLDDDPVVAAGQLADAYCCTVVMKGQNCSSACGDAVTICPATTPALATAGTGDVLAGMLGACLADSFIGGSERTVHLPDVLGAVSLGVYIHARAGELAAERLGVRSVIAQDVVDMIPRAFMELTA